ncbi:MAG TPA: hypothetical protein VF735_13370 [Pyrinomonadaceae bacterium]|jgi:hypothetical protein
MKLQRSAMALMIGLLIYPLAFAQSASPSDKPPDAEQRREASKEVVNKALALLEEITTEVSTLRLAENRVLIEARVADTLWAHNERRSRALIQEAIGNLNELMSGDAQDEGQTEAYAELRREILNILARHDPLLAREFLRATSQPLNLEEEVQLNLRLATEIAANDPQQALKIAQQVLAKGVSYQLIELLSQLKQKEPDAAARLAGEILNVLRTENLAANSEAASVAYELLLIGRGSSSAAAVAPDAHVPAMLTLSASRELVTMLASAALRAPASNQEMLLVSQQILPEVDKYAPSLAPRLRRKVTEQIKTSNEEESREDAPAEPSGPLPAETNPRRSNEERVAELVQQAREREEKGERGVALKLLEEAQGLLYSRAKNMGQLSAQLQVAQSYAALRPARSFAILEPLMDQLNYLADAAVTVDGFLTEEALARDDELLLKPMLESVSDTLNENNEGLRALTRANFDRTKAAADRLQRNELRIMARLLVAQSVLSEVSAEAGQ